MELDHSFEILGIERNSTRETAYQAYMDLVNVWHPDRFQHNPRLRHKAENKLKEINRAYETVKRHLGERNGEAAEHVQPSGGKRAPMGGPAHTAGRAEALAEAGTEFFLHLVSHLYNGLRRVMDAQDPQSRAPRNDESRTGDKVSEDEAQD